MVELIHRVKNVSEMAGLKLNLKKNSLMSTGEKLFVDGEDISTISSYQVFGAL
jgi:hypothetical protein